MSISDVELQLSFFMLSLYGFGIRVMVASLNEFGSIPSSAIFWKSFRRIVINTSHGFTGEFYQMFREELIPIFLEPGNYFLSEQTFFNG